MRVLLVHDFYQIPGGEDSVVREEFSMLEKNGIDVQLFSVTNEEIRGFWRTLATALRVTYNPSARRALTKKLADFSPDVVHIHNFFPLLSPSVFEACRQANVPSILTLHNFKILCPGALLYHDESLRERSLHHSCWWTVPKRVYRNSAMATLAVAAMVEFHKWSGTWTRKVDRFIALTDWAKQKFTEGGLPAERIIVKPSAVANPTALPARQREGGLFVGRLDKQKGIEILLRAWKSIDYPLTIIGDGPLDRLVREKQDDRIIYLGRQPRERVQREMRGAKFLVLPSIGNEMFPMTVVEAFSNGLPVIGSDLPSLRGLIEPDKNGLTFLPGSSDALATQIQWAISHPSALEELGHRARENYEELYMPETNFRQLIGLYHALAKQSYSCQGGLKKANA